MCKIWRFYCGLLGFFRVKYVVNGRLCDVEQVLGHVSQLLARILLPSEKTSDAWSDNHVSRIQLPIDVREVLKSSIKVSDVDSTSSMLRNFDSVNL